jgi:hypothetical protein
MTTSATSSGVEATCVGVAGAQCLLGDFQGAPVERLGFGIAAFVPVERGEIVQDRGNLGIVKSERLFENRQRPVV